MKRSSLVIFTLFCIGLTFSTCNQEKSNSNSAKEKVSISKELSEPCCEVTCRRGSCTSYQIPCTCACYAGQPVCSWVLNDGDKKKSFVPKIVVEVTPEQLALYDNDIEYIRNVLKNEKGAKTLENIKKLLVENNLTIASPESIEKYIEYLNDYAEFVDGISEIAVDKLSSME